MGRAAARWADATAASRRGSEQSDLYPGQRTRPKQRLYRLPKSRWLCMGGNAKRRCQQIERPEIHELHDVERPSFQYHIFDFGNATGKNVVWHLQRAKFIVERSVEVLHHARWFTLRTCELPLRGFVRNSLDWNVWRSGSFRG